MSLNPLNFGIKSLVKILENLKVDEEFNRKFNKIQKSIITCLKRGSKLIVAGNGGSASQAEHFVAEIVGRYKKKRNSLPALALSSNTSTITAIGNDFGYENIFSQQISSLANKYDLIILFTTSGKSKNIINAIKLCAQKKYECIVFCGNKGTLKNSTATVLRAGGGDTARIQEIQLFLSHVICEYVDKKF